MKYKDDLANGYVNGYYVGIKEGTPTQDELEPAADGYEVQRDTERFGTVTPDALESDYPELEDPEEEGDNG